MTRNLTREIVHRRSLQARSKIKLNLSTTSRGPFGPLGRGSELGSATDRATRPGNFWPGFFFGEGTVWPPLLSDTGGDSKLVQRRKRPKVDTLLSSLFFRRVRATSMTRRRVENTRVHFWTFSPVSVNLSTNKFLSIASCLIPQMQLGHSISNLKVQILLNYAATIRSQHFWARTAKWSAESLPRPAVVVENEKFFRITVIFSWLLTLYIPLRVIKAGRRCVVAHRATWHNWVTPSKNKEFLKSSCFLRS